MNSMLRIMLAFVVVLPLPLSNPSQAPAASSTVEPAIADLAGRLLSSLRKTGAKRVVVLDFFGPQKESHPVGKWLADELSAALKMNSTTIEVVDRSLIAGQADREEISSGAGGAEKRQMEIGRSVGADDVVTGNYAKIFDRLGITVLTTTLSRAGQTVPSIRGAVAISDEINGLSPAPIPSFNGDVLRAGIAGIGAPSCIYCPEPEYSNAARKAGYQGTVLLDVVVNAEGHVVKAFVIKGPGLGLEENSLRAVRGWRLKPAAGLDGKPVASKVQVEVSFHL
jgi:TonB family protein